MSDIPNVGSSNSVIFVQNNSNLSYPCLIQPARVSRSSVSEQGLRRGKPSVECLIKNDKDRPISWVICAAAWAVNLLVIGIHKVYGIFFVAFLKDFKVSSATAAWVGSLGSGLVLMFGPVSGCITTRFGHRISAVLGSLIAGMGLILTTYIKDFSNIFWTYSLLFGVGGSLCHVPAMCVSSLYFHRHISLAAGVVSSGSSIGTLILTPVTQHLVNLHGWRTAMRACGGMACAASIFAMAFRCGAAKREGELTKPENDKVVIVLDVSLLKNRVFQVWALSTSLSAFGFYIPFVHLIPHATDLGLTVNQRTSLPMAIAASTAAGKLIFGRIADFLWIRRILLLQLAISVSGLSTLFMPLAKTQPTLLVCCIVSGLADGCYAALLPVLTFHFLGPYNPAVAWGYLVAANSVTFMLGPVIAGVLRDRLGDYNVSFHLAGVFILLGAIFTVLLPWASIVQQHIERKRNLLDAQHGGAGESTDQQQQSAANTNRHPHRGASNEASFSGSLNRSRHQLFPESCDSLETAASFSSKNRLLSRVTGTARTSGCSSLSNLPVSKLSTITLTAVPNRNVTNARSLPIRGISDCLLHRDKNKDRTKGKGQCSSKTPFPLTDQFSFGATDCDVTLYILQHQASWSSHAEALFPSPKIPTAPPSNLSRCEQQRNKDSAEFEESKRSGTDEVNAAGEVQGKESVVIFMAPPEVSQAITQGQDILNIRILHGHESNDQGGKFDHQHLVSTQCDLDLYPIKEESEEEEIPTAPPSNLSICEQQRNKDSAEFEESKRSGTDKLNAAGEVQGKESVVIFMAPPEVSQAITQGQDILNIRILHGHESNDQGDEFDHRHLVSTRCDLDLYPIKEESEEEELDDCAEERKDDASAHRNRHETKHL